MTPTKVHLMDMAAMTRDTDISQLEVARVAAFYDEHKKRYLLMWSTYAVGDVERPPPLFVASSLTQNPLGAWVIWALDLRPDVAQGVTACAEQLPNAFHLGNLQVCGRLGAVATGSTYAARPACRGRAAAVTAADSDLGAGMAEVATLTSGFKACLCLNQRPDWFGPPSPSCACFCHAPSCRHHTARMGSSLVQQPHARAKTRPAPPCARSFRRCTSCQSTRSASPRARPTKTLTAARRRSSRPCILRTGRGFGRLRKGSW